MILGVSHLAIRTATPDAEQRALEAQGWTTDFIDDRVMVHPAERPFLSPLHPARQKLIYMRSATGMPALEFVSPVTGEDGVEHASMLDVTQAGASVGSGTLLVPDLAAALEFFCAGLGFGPVSAPTVSEAIVRMTRPLRQWEFQLTLRQSQPAAEQPTLDCNGWFVLGLLSNSLTVDINQLRGFRFVTGIVPPFELRVANNVRMVGMCILQSGFAIELIQPVSANGSASAEIEK
jgi:hypothetical protein